VLIVSYFDNHQYWLGSAYFSLLAAPIPRGVWADKPPVDSGVYLRNIALGAEVNPPVPLNQLIPTGYTERNWAGYMNYGLFGLIALHVFSGALFALVYNYMRCSDYSVGTVVFYSIFAYGGTISLSPLGITGILTNIFFLSVLMALSRFRF